MRHKKLILLSLVFISISLSLFSNEVKAVNYDVEIGLTFNSDVAARNTQNTTSSDTSSAENTDDGSSSSSEVSRDTTKFPDTGIKKTIKSGLTSILPSTGSENSNLLVLIGVVTVIIGLVLLGVKFYRQKKGRR